MKLSHATDLHHLKTDMAVQPSRDKDHQNISRGILSRITKVLNSLFSLDKKRNHSPREMHISSPQEARVSACVFKIVPEKLQPYCSDGIINLDKRYFLKDSIMLTSSTVCSEAGIRALENKHITDSKSGSFELVRAEPGCHIYQHKDGDYAPEQTWL